MDFHSFTKKVFKKGKKFIKDEEIIIFDKNKQKSKPNANKRLRL